MRHQSKPRESSFGNYWGKIESSERFFEGSHCKLEVSLIMFLFLFIVQKLTRVSCISYLLKAILLFAYHTYGILKPSGTKDLLNFFKVAFNTIGVGQYQ
jgi:hypothetical protein